MPTAYFGSRSRSLQHVSKLPPESYTESSGNIVQKPKSKPPTCLQHAPRNLHRRRLALTFNRPRLIPLRVGPARVPRNQVHHVEIPKSRRYPRDCRTRSPPPFKKFIRIASGCLPCEAFKLCGRNWGDKRCMGNCTADIYTAMGRLFLLRVPYM